MENNPFKQAAEDAAKRTDEKYSEDIKNIQGLDPAIISKLFPTPADRQKLTALIEATKAATSEAELLSKLRDGASDLGQAAVKLLKAVIVA